MKRFLVSLGFLLIIIVVLTTGCDALSSAPPSTSLPSFLAATPAAVDVKTLKFSYTMPKASPSGQAFEWFGPEFAKRTEGRYEVETYPSSSLVSSSATLDAVKTGVCEIAFTSSGSFANDFPLSMVASLPTMGFPGITADDFSASLNAWSEFYGTVPEIQAEFEEFKLLAPIQGACYILASKKNEVHSPTDLKGMRVGGSVKTAALLAANGAVNVNEIPPESYMNLDKGVTDASIVAWGHILNYKLTEVCDHYFNYDFGSSTYFILMNNDMWNGMPQHDQKTLIDTWWETAEKTSVAFEKANSRGFQAVLDAGQKISEATLDEQKAWSESAEVCFTGWIDDCEALGIPHDTAAEVLAQWKEISAKYRK